MNHQGYCHRCYKRIGQRKEACPFCGGCDYDGPKQPAEAPSIGMVPVSLYLPREVYESIKARVLALSSKSEETVGISELVADTMRRALAG